jgi:tetratricopeptide (TPR) repeat protein
MQYRNLLLLALSLGLTITISPSISLAKPAASTIAANSDRFTAPKLISDESSNRSIDTIIQDEANWLKRPPSAERHEKLFQFGREIVAAATMSNQLPMNEAIPSKASIGYFQELIQKYPQSGVIASFYARSMTAEMTDDRQIAQIYDAALAKHPTHPVLLIAYRDTMLQKYDNKLPTPIVATLTKLYDRAIVQEPKNVALYIDRAGITPKAPATILQQWQATEAKFPNNPTITEEFSRLLLGSEDSDSANYPKTVAIAIQQVEAAIKQNPQSGPLYELYRDLYSKTKTPQKAIPVLQAGFAKGAEAARLNYLIGDVYLLAGDVDSAIGHYRKVVQAKTALCWGNMIERFEGLKNPEQQRAMLNLMIQSLTLKGGEECIQELGVIGFNPEMNQRFGKEMIAAITPIAQSSKDISLQRVLLGLMIRQKQYAEITKIGPKLLPDNGIELTQFEYIEATHMPWYIAEAHENLGSFRQAETFYQLLGEYSQASLFGRSSEYSKEYANHIMDWHLGRIAWKSGKSVEAVKKLQNVIAKQRGLTFETLDGNEIAYHALAHNLLGEIYQSQGKKAEAKQQFEAAIKATPEFRAPKDNLAKLK